MGMKEWEWIMEGMEGISPKFTQMHKVRVSESESRVWPGEEPKPKNQKPKTKKKKKNQKPKIERKTKKKKNQRRRKKKKKIKRKRVYRYIYILMVFFADIIIHFHCQSFSEDAAYMIQRQIMLVLPCQARHPPDIITMSGFFICLAFHYYYMLMLFAINPTRGDRRPLEYTGDMSHCTHWLPQKPCPVRPCHLSEK